MKLRTPYVIAMTLALALAVPLGCGQLSFMFVLLFWYLNGWRP